MGRSRFIGYSVIASTMRVDRLADGRFMMGASASVNGRLMMRARASVGARCMVPSLMSIGGSAYPTSMNSALMRAARFALTTFLTMIRLVG
jgi:hypothetical protein